MYQILVKILALNKGSNVQALYPEDPKLPSEIMNILEARIPGLLPSPCFYNFLARTTFVLESLPEAKNPGQDAFFGYFVFNNSTG